MRETTPRPTRQPNGDPAVDTGTKGESVGRPLSETEDVEGMAKCRQYVLSLLPHAIKVIADSTRSDIPRLRLSAAIELCKIAGVSKSDGMEQTTPDQKREEQRLVSLGLMMEHMLAMSETYQMPLPKSFIDDVKQVVDRVANLERILGTEEDEETGDRLKGRVAIAERPARSHG